jgi:hypothetical protein
MNKWRRGLQIAFPIAASLLALAWAAVRLVLAQQPTTDAAPTAADDDAWNVELIGSLDTYFAHSLAISETYAYVTAGWGGGLQIVDVSEPAAPVGVGFWNYWGDSLGVAISGTYAYVAAYSGGLRVVDVSDPTNPTEVGSCDTPQEAWDVTVSGNYAYVANREAGLAIIDLSDPSNPVEVGAYDTPGDAVDVTVLGMYAYVADRDGGLRVLDVTDPAHPTEVGAYEMVDAYAHGTTVFGNHAYVAAGYDGLWVLDVSDPGNPVEVGTYDTLASATSVALFQDYAYVADWPSGLRVVDVSMPSAPTEVGFYYTPSAAREVAVSGVYVYISDESGGLLVLRFVLAVPTLLPINNNDGDGDYQVEWSTVRRATSYTLQQDNSPAFDSPTTVYTGSDPQYWIADQAAGSWYYRVCANTDDGSSGWSLTEFVNVKAQVYLPSVLRSHTLYYKGPWEAEPNDSYTQANGPLRSGKDYYGYPDDEKDYFSIYLSTAGDITIDLQDHTGQGVQLQLFYESTDNRVAWDLDPPYHIGHAGGAGWYYVYIFTESGYNSTTPYTLRVTYP